MRIIPADPRCINSNLLNIASCNFVFNHNELVSSPSVKIVNFDENNNINMNKLVSSKLNINQHNINGCSPDYPFIYKSRIIFFVKRQNIFPLSTTFTNHLVNHFLKLLNI